jgi:NDP-sugar pyrophosphorylase family protein
MIISGVIANLVFKFDEQMSFIVALLVFAVLELLFLLLSFESLSEIGRIFNLIAQSFEKSGRFSDFFNVELVSSLGGANREILSDGISISKTEDVALLWLRCLSNFETSAQITNYMHPDVWVDMGYSRANLEVQKIMIAEKRVDIVRIFIWETPDEFDKLQEVMKEQKKFGAKVKHLQLDKISKNNTLQQYAKKLGTMDFVIFDNSYILLHYLDKQRNTKSAKLTKNKKVVENGKEFFNLLEKLVAEDFENGNTKAAVSC